MSPDRSLTIREQAVLATVLREATFAGADDLARQVEAVSVIGGPPTFLDLEVRTSAPTADLPDGPIPVRAFVDAATGDVEGEVIIWVTAGRLSGLEYAWFGDETPTEMPDATRLRLG